MSLNSCLELELDRRRQDDVADAARIAERRQHAPGRDGADGQEELGIDRDVRGDFVDVQQADQADIRVELCIRCRLDTACVGFISLSELVVEQADRRAGRKLLVIAGLISMAAAPEVMPALNAAATRPAAAPDRAHSRTAPVLASCRIVCAASISTASGQVPARVQLRHWPQCPIFYLTACLGRGSGFLWWESLSASAIRYSLSCGNAV